jgi:4-hydroxyphenylpyruvate dioxygenase
MWIRYLFLFFLAYLCFVCQSFCVTSFGKKLFSLNIKKTRPPLQLFQSKDEESPDFTRLSSFHHLEFFVGDATLSRKCFMHGLGLELVGKSDLSTGNDMCSSYFLQSGDVKMIFTAPNLQNCNQAQGAMGSSVISPRKSPFPFFDGTSAFEFFRKHGTAVKAVAISVHNVTDCFNKMVKNGANAMVHPCVVEDHAGLGSCEWAEVQLYGDVNLRLLNTNNFKGTTLPNFVGDGTHGQTNIGRYGIKHFDHIVGNVWSLQQTISYLKKATVLFAVIAVLPYS